jgi:hypothetical protein
MLVLAVKKKERRIKGLGRMRSSPFILLSFFTAKTNIAYRKGKETDMGHPR